MTPVEPLLASTTIVIMVMLAYLIVRSKDLVYASASLALLGMFNAILAAILGYVIVAVFLVIVYVGAAVMFIIVTVSMLGGGGGERVDHEKGLLAGATLAMAIAAIVIVSRLYAGYARPSEVSVASVSTILASNYAPVIALLFVALAATLVEAISIARRG